MVKNHRLKQKFYFLVNHISRSVYVTSGNIKRDILKAAWIDFICTFSLFLKLHKDVCISRILRKTGQHISTHQPAGWPSVARITASLMILAYSIIKKRNLCLGLVHGDDPQRCYGEWGGRGGSCLGTHVRIKDLKIKKIKREKPIKRQAYLLQFSLVFFFLEICYLASFSPTNSKLASS